MVNPVSLPAWKTLLEISEGHGFIPSALGFEEVRHLNGLSICHRYQGIDAATQTALQTLAQQARVQDAALGMARGEPVNATENRAALHVALRGPEQNTLWPASIAQEVHAQKSRFLAFAQAVRSGQVMGPTGQVITDVVNIGIGGSDLGPRMAGAALHHLASSRLGPRLHFISNPDLWCLKELLETLSARKTLFIVQSKTFTTPETRSLFASLLKWVEDDLGPNRRKEAMQAFVAVTAAPDISASLGFEVEQTFHIWDWVGGRYSLWSAMGLPLAIQIGPEAFEDLLDGARGMDEHFLHAPMAQNLPIQLALVGLWNRNFRRCASQVVAVYDWRLRLLVPYLQQLEMESNGKRVQIDGQPCETATAPALWGGLGLDGQHAYFQMLHQGSDVIPVDFVCTSGENFLNTSARAQQQALWEGLEKASSPHRTHPGRRPSSRIELDALTPHALGSLIALYEHKVFTQSVIWNINAFDQFGVELGKSLALAARPGKATKD
ncbi:MAG: glucose-6-phosphate isomerase [Betaproteobacteria bacterium]|nr:glucose-6-phosphate isomerase [Betaproteobacteria bacterium]